MALASRRRTSRARLAVAVVAFVVGIGFALPASSSAHNSAWCGHGAHFGTHWFLYYDGAYAQLVRTTPSEDVYIHEHVVDHSYRKNAQFLYAYRHTKVHDCGIVTVGLHTDSVDAGTFYDSGELILGGFAFVLDPTSDVFDTDNPTDACYDVSQTVCEDIYCATGVGDPVSCRCDQPIPCLAAQTSSPQVPVAKQAEAAGAKPDRKLAPSLRDPARLKASLERLGYEVRPISLEQGRLPGGKTGLVDRPASGVTDAGCVTAIGDAGLDGFEPGHAPHVLGIEVASRETAREAGHYC
jgi:hypothetical protein